MSVLKGVFAIAPTIFNEFRRDDFIESQVIAYDMTKPETCFLPREYQFSGRSGKYNIGVRLEKVAD